MPFPGMAYLVKRCILLAPSCCRTECLQGLCVVSVWDWQEQEAWVSMQLGGSVQQAQQQMDQRQDVFSKLQTQLISENAARDQAARVPIAVPVPPPAYQDRVSCQCYRTCSA